MRADIAPAAAAQDIERRTSGERSALRAKTDQAPTTSGVEATSTPTSGAKRPNDGNVDDAEGVDDAGVDDADGSTTVAGTSRPPVSTVPAAPKPSPRVLPPPPTTAPPVPTTLPPVVAVDSQEGFALWSWSVGGYATAEAAAALDSLVEVGADSVAFVPLYYVDSVRSSKVQADPWVTADAASLRAGIAAAHARGLRVTVRPLVDVRDGSWRGDISPIDRVSWFASYRAIVGDLASMSAELGVEQFVVGTELHSLSTDTAAWRRVINDVRDRFAGNVSYAALPFEWSHITFWDALDIIGINAWSKLSDHATTDVGALTRAWERELDRYEAAANQWRKPVLITEAGFTTQHGTATAPWRWDHSLVYAPAEQDAGYRALFAAMADEDWLIGVHFWAWRVTDRPEPLDFTPQGTATEQSVRAAWR